MIKLLAETGQPSKRAFERDFLAAELNGVCLDIFDFVTCFLALLSHAQVTDDQSTLPIPLLYNAVAQLQKKSSDIRTAPVEQGNKVASIGFIFYWLFSISIAGRGS